MENNEELLKRLIERLEKGGQKINPEDVSTPGRFRADATMRAQRKIAELMQAMSYEQLSVLLEWIYDLQSLPTTAAKLLVLEGLHRLDDRLGRSRRRVAT